MKILLGVTGSVATRLLDKMVDKLKKNNHEVVVVFTDMSLQFVNVDPCNPCQPEYKYYMDIHEFYGGESPIYQKGDPITHIELRDWADMLIICPCSANTMAKMANGICDNLLTSVFRAWDFSKPIYITPAMNTNMWTHPITVQHIDVFRKWNVKVIYPTVEKLACGSYGIGALADLDMIVNIAEGHVWKNPLGDDECPYIPVYPHPGSFGVDRHRCYHTGVDLYTKNKSYVHAVEDGGVIDIGQFTGEAVDSGYWNDTSYISIKGKSGVICYGEIDVDDSIVIGDYIKAGELIGYVKQVLKKSPKNPPPYHSLSMLHLELFRKDSPETFSQDWIIGEKKPKGLLDPTAYLMIMKNGVQEPTI